VKQLFLILICLFQSGCAYGPIANFGIGSTRNSAFVERHIAVSGQSASGSSCRGYGTIAGYPRDYASIHEAMVDIPIEDPKLEGELLYRLEISRSYWFPVFFFLTCYSAEAVPVDLH